MLFKNSIIFYLKKRILKNELIKFIQGVMHMFNSTQKNYNKIKKYYLFTLLSLCFLSSMYSSKKDYQDDVGLIDEISDDYIDDDYQKDDCMGSLFKNIETFFTYYNDHVYREYRHPIISNIFDIVKSHAEYLSNDYTLLELNKTVSLIANDIKMFFNSQAQQNIINAGTSYFSCNNFHNENSLCFNHNCYTTKEMVHQNRDNISLLLNIFQAFYFLLYPLLNSTQFEQDEIDIQNNFLVATANVFCNNLKKNYCSINNILDSTHYLINNFIFLQRQSNSFVRYYSPKMIYKRLFKYKQSNEKIIAAGVLYQYLIHKKRFNWELLNLKA